MSEAGRCQRAHCADPPLSFSHFCWEHCDPNRFLSELHEGLRRATGPLKLNLKKAECHGLDLSGRELSGSSFSQAKLTGCSFVGTTLRDADFIGARLQSCDFVGADLSGANLTCARLDHVSFSHADLRGAWLNESRIRETDFMGALLHGAGVWNADLAGPLHLKKKNFEDPATRRAACAENDPLVASECYRLLKHHFYATGLLEDGSWAGYRELTMARKNYFKRRDPRYVPSLLMDLLSGYTEKPNRVILSSFVLVVVFALLYWTLDAAHPSSNPLGPRLDFWQSLYFSFITFATVGYGDIVPRSGLLFRYLACAEGFSGPFMAGLYIFTLTRRYAAS